MNKFKQFIHEFFVFGLKQAYACMFGGFLLAVMLVTKYWYPIEGLHRYDFIFSGCHRLSSVHAGV